MLKRLFLILLLLTAGCSYNSGRVQFFNYDVGTTLFGSVPDYITVAKGDTLYSISRRYDTPLRDLITANNITPPYSLAAGQMIRIPKAKYHVVAKGDTLYNVSKRYNVDITTLSRLNDLTPPYGLGIGQKLSLPGSISSGSSGYGSYTPPSPAPQAAKPKSKSFTLPDFNEFAFWRNRDDNKASESFDNSKVNLRQESKTYTPPATPIKPRKSKFQWPVKGSIISKFGTIGKGRTNDGINIRAPEGAAVNAADAGVVVYSGNELKGFGNLILIRHSDGWVTAYAHNRKLLVKKGQKVVKGEKISTIGDTGGVNEPQLHFEVRNGKKPLNPLSYLP